jgi:hypothetical protein
MFRSAVCDKFGKELGDEMCDRKKGNAMLRKAQFRYHPDLAETEACCCAVKNFCIV